MSSVPGPTDDAGRACPVYLVCESVRGPVGRARAEEFRTALMDVADHFARRPALDQAVRMSVLSFGDCLDVVVPLGNPARWRRSDLRFGSPGRPDYRAMFAALRARLDRDQQDMEASGLQVLRPIVVVAVASGPADDDPWQDGWAELLDGDRFPIVASVCVAGDVAEVVPRLSNPPGVGRCYGAAAPEHLGELTGDVLIRTAQRLLEVGGGQDVEGSPLPGEDEVGCVPVVPPAVAVPDPDERASPPAGAAALLSLPALRTGIDRPAPSVVPVVFYFDMVSDRLVSGPGPDVVGITVEQVERLLSARLRNGTSARRFSRFRTDSSTPTDQEGDDHDGAAGPDGMGTDAVRTYWRLPRRRVP